MRNGKLTECESKIDLQLSVSHYDPVRGKEGFELLVHRIAGMGEVMGNHPPAGEQQARLSLGELDVHSLLHQSPLLLHAG
jgi:hypothetical protein